MPAKDKYHDVVRLALELEGWTITHDPLFIRLGRKRGYIDLGAEIIAAEKGKEKIAVEVKSFLNISEVDDFEDALGQFLVYHFALLKKEPDRKLYLAVPKIFYNSFFDDSFFVELAEHYDLKMIIFDEIKQKIELWKR